MPAHPSPIIPFLHYQDLDRAVPWLVAHFGFGVQSTERDKRGRAAMAVLHFDGGLIYARQADDAIRPTRGTTAAPSGRTSAPIAS